MRPKGEGDKRPAPQEWRCFHSVDSANNGGTKIDWVNALMEYGCEMVFVENMGGGNI